MGQSCSTSLAGGDLLEKAAPGALRAGGPRAHSPWVPEGPWGSSCLLPELPVSTSAFAISHPSVVHVREGQPAASWRMRYKECRSLGRGVSADVYEGEAHCRSSPSFE